MADRLSIKRNGDRSGYYASLLHDAFDRALAIEGKVSEETLALEGMSGRNYRLFINNLVHLMPSPRYLEVGSWAGSTACAAMDGNKLKILCIDNWSDFGGPKDKFFANTAKVITDKVDFRFLECDFRDVDFRAVGDFNIYLFDGPHEAKDQYDGLAMAAPAMDNVFVLIVDDWNWEHVRQGTLDAIRETSLRVVTSIEVRTTQDNAHTAYGNADSDWHNGYFLSVLEKL